MILCYFTGMRDVPGMIILIFYCLAGLIRLAYFNVLEERRQQETDENRKYYQGLPITSIAVILPLAYVTSSLYAQHFSHGIACHHACNWPAVHYPLPFPQAEQQRDRTADRDCGGLHVVYILLYFRWRGYVQWSWKHVWNTIMRKK